jgi:hypothetical protein
MAVKVESAQGTAETLAAGDATGNYFDVSPMSYDVPQNTRQGQSSLSMLPGVAGARMARQTFTTELYGSASIPQTLSDLFRASGMLLTSRTLTFTTGASNAATLTIGHNQDGRFHQMSGAVGNWTLTGDSGSPARVSWDFQGVYIAPSTAAALAPTYDTTLPPRVASCTFTIGGTSYTADGFSLTAGNSIAMIQDVTTASGYKHGVVTDRAPRLSVRALGLALSTKDWFAQYLVGTTAAASIVIGSDANNIITLTMPVVQLAAPPAVGDRDGLIIDNLEFQLCRSAAAGDDELSIVFS